MFDPQHLILPLGLAPTTSATNTGAAVNPAVSAATTQGAATTQVASTDGATTKPAGGFLQMLTSVGPILLMLAVVYLFLFRGQKKDEKKRKSMLEEMKKGDTVMTIGGLIARVVSIDGDNVTLKIDESANVKAVYTKRSIQQVLTDEDKSK